MRFVLDIPIDQELPDDEPGRRNKDIVNYRYYVFQSNEFGSFFSSIINGYHLSYYFKHFYSISLGLFGVH